jgi:chemotaxis protein MotB
MNGDGPPPRQRITKDSPGWMVTYADMMSLLLCLFILILSFAKIDSTQFARTPDRSTRLSASPRRPPT